MSWTSQDCGSGRCAGAGARDAGDGLEQGIAGHDAAAGGVDLFERVQAGAVDGPAGRDERDAGREQLDGLRCYPADGLAGADFVPGHSPPDGRGFQQRWADSQSSGV